MTRAVVTVIFLLIIAPANGNIHAEKSVADWANDLVTDDPFDARRAAIALGQMGIEAAPAIPNLVQALVDDREADPTLWAGTSRALNVSMFADRALRDLSPHSIGPLIAALSKPNADLRLRAAETLFLIDGDRSDALPTLKRLATSDESDDVRVAALRAYCTICKNDMERLATLTAAMKDPLPEMRGIAAIWLWRNGALAVDELVALLDDKGSYTRDFYPVGVFYIIREDAARALGQIGPPARGGVERLSVMMKEDRDPQVRAEAACSVILIQEGSQEALDVLIQLLKDDDVRGARAAASALWGVGEHAAPAFDLLCQAAESEDDSLRSSAVLALGRIGNRDALIPLVNALNDDDWLVRLQAAKALGEMGADAAVATPFLLEVVRSSDDFMFRKAAAESLGKMGPRAAAALSTLEYRADFDKDESMRREATLAVKRILRVE